MESRICGWVNQYTQEWVSAIRKYLGLTWLIETISQDCMIE